MMVDGLTQRLLLKKSACAQPLLRIALDRYQVAMLEFLVLLILSLSQHNRVKLFGSIADSSRLCFGEPLAFTPIYYFGTNPNDTRGRDERANCSAFTTISL